MKHYFSTLAILILTLSLASPLVSCSNSTKQENSIANDSIVAINNKAQIIAERAEKFKAEDDKVLGNIKFFISQKEWEKNINENLSEFRNPDRSIGASYYIIGNYGFFTSYPAFYNDSLYKVQIRGTFAYHDDYAAKIPADYKAIMDLLTIKYGEPDESIELPKFHQTPSDGLIPLAAWQVGPRMISVVLNCDNAKYGIDLFIYRKDIADRKDKENQEKANQRTEADVDRI
ncbi:MAG: hypothetical protein K2M88_03185 [Muribaculaceae bacterium]|nr:hypothetical protein [Muribaculaceae bacterium]